MTPLKKTSVRGLTLGTTGALVAGLIAATATPAGAAPVDVPPAKTVSGELAGPIGMEDDAAGNIYVASQNNDSVVVHRKNASGPSAPLRRISGAATGLNGPRDVALDANGFLYVSQIDGTVSVFAPNADGNVAPVKTFGTGAGPAWGVDVAGGEIYVRKSDRYNVYAPSATGATAPTERSVTGLGTGQSLAVSGSKVWVPNGTQLRAYSRSADGAGATPIQSVTNALPNTEINGLDTDAAGRVHVATFSPATVRVFAPNADGAEAPLKVLGGPASGLSLATGLTVLGNGSFAVAHFFQAKYSVFPDLFRKPVTRPGKVRALKVRGKAVSKNRKISWRAPASNGGARITAYRVIVRKGGKVLVKRTVSGSRRSLVVKRAKLRRGVDAVYVQARNAQGYGPVVKKNFRVRK
ncbi:hypothetical protein H9L21_02050 [Aeromicrobium senzhongii]|uniref:Fibronectin type-III domain-containing protein n=1 Tax=Aeromicrobium senzhongii TaxID=2663859 RepID=A0ABX6STP6_9ACTN|nr:hypothetical protein [Aeromicrobium senzhongii]MTB88245.1 hypothetical protein [Aeromicrobium senzhongii]QNL94769.1 hypothetical protein H9L21_02050 [Aeromicrobium senzhongii]